MSSRHDGVSCDACLKAYFRGRRYKCLICFDYDLCSSCYENGSTTNQHTTDHPMQCILTRHDFDIFHGGEALASDQPQSLTCPFCGKMGFTEATLHEHVTGTHPDTSYEVVCPVCASVLGGDPNHLTDDFALHLTREHWPGTRDLDDTGSRHGVRRVPHQGRGLSRGVARQNNMRSVGGGFFTSSRDSMDPIAELLSQLSGVRRATTATRQQQLANRRAASGTTSSLPSGANSTVSNSQINVTNVPESNNVSSSVVGSSNSSSNQAGVVVSFGSSSASNMASAQHQVPPVLVHSNNRTPGGQSQFLLGRLSDMENEQEGATEARSRAAFVQELLLSTLSELSLGGIQDLKDLNTSSVPGRFIIDLRNSGTSQSSEQVPSVPTTSDAATQTATTIASTPTTNYPSNPLSQLTGHPITKTSSTNSVTSTTMKGTKVPSKAQLVTRSSPGLQPLSLQQQQQSNGSNLGSGRVVTGTGTVSIQPQMGGRGRATGGSVSPGSNRRKPVRGVESRATQPPPPH